MIGARGWNPTTEHLHRGRVQVFFARSLLASSGWGSAAGVTDAPEADLTLNASPASGDLGFALVGVPDLDGDGDDEVLLASPNVAASTPPGASGGFVLWLGNNLQ